MNDWILYYNPKCGTCRNVRERIEGRGIKPRIVEYLRTPLTADELESILKKLGAGPEAITRMKEPLIEEKGIRFEGMARKDWVKLLAENPVLIQRPILVHGDRALVGRPPESVDAFLEGSR